MVIDLPRMIYLNTIFDKQLRLIETLNEDEEVCLSFRSVDFILPESTILLIALSKQINNKTKTVVKWIDIKNELITYLERIQIDKLNFIQIPKTIFFKKNKKSNSLVEMRIMSNPNQFDEIISETKKIMYDWFPGRYGDEYVKQISGYIRDIAANSLEHSEKDGNGICYYTLQKYDSVKEKTTIHVAFGDTGMGIDNSLIQKYQWIVQRKKRPIVCAFIDGLSCRGNDNGGLGFRMVKQQLKKYGGEIQIRSGKEMIRYFGSGKYKVTDFNHSIIGTQTLFILK